MLLAPQRLEREALQVAIRGQSQIGVRDLGDQAQLCAAARLLLCQILLERGVGQAADAAEAALADAAATFSALPSISDISLFSDTGK